MPRCRICRRPASLAAERPGEDCSGWGQPPVWDYYCRNHAPPGGARELPDPRLPWWRRLADRLAAWWGGAAG